MTARRILVTGSLGQIGSELLVALRERVGAENVIATDVRKDVPSAIREAGPWFELDVLDPDAVMAAVSEQNVDTVYHLAAILSAVAEQIPQQAWRVNMVGLFNVLEAARENGCSIFVPSSIAAFGRSTPLDNTPQVTIQRPNSLYGVTKVSGELLCDYYYDRFGVDVRGLRYPGIISHLTAPGGGTTDYAVEIYYKAVTDGRYICPLGPDTSLDMMYMPDALRSAIELMDADPERLNHRNAYNVTAMCFTPEDLAAAIREIIPDFEIDYAVDPVKQAIANSWPNCLDDTAARRDWGWSPEFDIAAMTADMISVLRKRREAGRL